MKLKLVLFSVLLLIGDKVAAQSLNVWGFGVTSSIFKAKELTVNNRMIGGKIFYAYANDTRGLGPRIEFEFLKRVNDSLPNTQNINSHSNVNLTYGKIINNGKRLQFPVYAGFSLNFTGGNWHISGWGLNVKAGTRFYAGKKWAIFGELCWNGYIDPEVKIKYSSGKTEDKSVPASNLGLTIGLIF
jgi:hypothetical protein